MAHGSRLQRDGHAPGSTFTEGRMVQCAVILSAAAVFIVLVTSIMLYVKLGNVQEAFGSFAQFIAARTVDQSGNGPPVYPNPGA